MQSPSNAVKVTVNGGARTVQVPLGRPLLYGLMAEGMFIPSGCGGRGNCGQCKVRVMGRELPYAPAELPLVAEPDRQRGTHLSCQVVAAENLSIEIPPDHLTARQYEAEAVKVQALTADIFRIDLKVSGASLDFIAGQYVQVFIPGTENSPEPKYRAYSIASAPSAKRLLTLIVRREPEGTVSPYLCGRLAPGDRLPIRGPFGEFRLHYGPREMVLVAGGSGMAPIRSLLLSMAEAGIRRPATYYFTARTERDLFMVAEMRELERRMPDFRFVPSLSNPLPGEPWQGEKGGITSVLARRLGALDRHEAYLCGSAGMIDAAISVLRSKGLPEELIFFDKFL
ncbi:MAG TPA: 2Fe-2S iron-sulfur cluster binding domain-containing protein [Spirochaetia bacterium]|nr:2Fe-2S iron-sulfur cluster binding domain-containing protein [Spirochaetia bacterium]